MKKLSMRLVFALALGVFAFSTSTAFAAEEKKEEKAEGKGEKKPDKKDKKEKKEGAEAPKGGW